MIHKQLGLGDKGISFSLEFHFNLQHICQCNIRWIQILTLYLPQNTQVRLSEGYNLILGFLETPCLSRVPWQATHESEWGSTFTERKSQIKQNAPWSETKFSNKTTVIILKKKSYHLKEELIHKKEDIKLH